MNNKIIFIILILWLVLVSVAVFAQSPGTSALVFLKIDPAAESASLAGISGLPTSQSIYKNQAVLPWVNTKEVSFQYVSYLLDTAYNQASFISPIDDRSAVSCTVGVLSVSGLERTRYDASSSYGYVKDGSVPFSDTMAEISYGRKVSGDLSLGASLKGVQEKIDTNTTLTPMFSMSGYYFPENEDKVMSFGVFNLGPRVNGFDLPYGGFVGFGLHKDKKHFLLCEATAYGDKTVVLSAGAHIEVSDAVSIRFGSKNQLEYQSMGKPSNNGLSMGISFNIGSCKLDYAWSPTIDLGQINRFSLTFKL
jgi:predicted lipoprotein